MTFQKGNTFGKPHWVKGQSGNPKGRAVKGATFKEILKREVTDPAANDSLRDTIRAESAVAGAEVDRKVRMVRRVWSLASDPHDRPDLVLHAFDRLAKWGWPEEAALHQPETPAVRVVIIHQEVTGVEVHRKEIGE